MDNLQFILIDRSGLLVQEWTHAFSEHISDPTIRAKFTMLTMRGTLSDLGQFDCIVSPANSYGRLDGGFDQAISEALSPSSPLLPTHLAQKTLYSRYKGYAPPGTCTLVPLAGTACSPSNNPHACAYIALCPTMRVPEDVRWNREIVYNLMWALLVELERHNRAVAANSIGDGTSSDKGASGEITAIRKVLMTGFGTGAGNISAARCAQQMALAVKHFVDACAHPHKWSSLEWDDALSYAGEVRRTHDL
ncbi:hypothetical protein CVT25_000614 [Psilocybe cyanescens]|uniref:Macro-like domain-containing protein n=1 Tax=Psilocybe cyanescens TaxID=93625 RepID=A0A409XWD1_PSICY|nr:hypothetical protein CVT25_000614 [Psilocybe cyanescens]